MELKELVTEEHEIVYLPKNLNLDELVNHHPPKVKRYHRNRIRLLERIALILGQLYYRMIRTKDFDEKFIDGFVPLNMQILESLDEGATYILNWAIEIGIVVSDKHYLPGSKSRGYKFSEELFPESRMYYIYDKTIIKKLRLRRLDEKSIKAFPFLYDCLQQIEIDYEGAENTLMGLLSGDKNSMLKYECRKRSIEELNANKLHFKRDTTVGRLHTNITGIKKECRKHLTWQKNELINIDIRNSQPFFSLCLLLPIPYKTLNIPEILNNYNSNITTIMFRRFEEMFGTYSNGYIESVVDGVLYDEMAVKLGIERAEAKDLMFNIFFSVPTWNFKGKVEFIEAYPQVWELFKLINIGFTKTKNQGRKYWEQSSALALTLQRVESIVMLEYIVPEILNSIPGLPIWTIHDSIMTLKGEEEHIKQIIQKVCEKLIGVTPTISYE